MLGPIRNPPRSWDREGFPFRNPPISGDGVDLRPRMRGPRKASRSIVGTWLPAAFLTFPLLGCAMGGALFKAAFLRSGAPPREEVIRMEEREAVFLRELSHRSVLVLPVGVLNVEATYRESGARELAAALREAGFPGARAGTRAYSLPYPRQPNEAWTYWKRFRALADSVRRSPPGEADYVLLMDILGGTNDDGTFRGIGAVHVVTTTGTGEMAYGRLRNSYHDIFQGIDPRTLQDACRLAVEDIRLARREVMAEAGSTGEDS